MVLGLKKGVIFLTIRELPTPEVGDGQPASKPFGGRTRQKLPMASMTFC
jgi:hypothetical protein